MFDATQKGSPEYWVKTLSERLDKKRRRLEMLQNYDTGNHPIPDLGGVSEEQKRRFVERSRSNYVGLINNSVIDRVKPIGFRTSEDNDDNGDELAWAVWKRNGMRSRMTMLARNVVALGEGYAMVVPDDNDVRISVESPLDTIVETDPQDNRKIVAALKRWVDLDDTVNAVLQLGDKLYYAAGMKTNNTETKSTGNNYTWRWVKPPADNPVGRPTIVRFVNRPQTTAVVTAKNHVTDSLAECEDVLDIQDRITGEIFNRCVISVSQAFRQRWAKLGDVKYDDDELERILRSDPGAVWALSGNPEFGDFSESTMQGPLQAGEEDVKQLSSITRTPPHYLLGNMTNLSADALHAAKDGHTAKIEDRLANFEEGLAAVMGLCFEILGDDSRAKTNEIEVIWKPVDKATLAERADAMTKLSNVLPLPALLREIGEFSPAAVSRILLEVEEQRLDDVIRGMIDGNASADTSGTGPNASGSTAPPATEPSPGVGS